jgi:hypothetical protein
MTNAKATTDAAAEPAVDPVADPLPWLLRNIVQRQARSAQAASTEGLNARRSNGEANQRAERGPRPC